MEMTALQTRCPKVPSSRKANVRGASKLIPEKYSREVACLQACSNAWKCKHCQRHCGAPRGAQSNHRNTSSSTKCLDGGPGKGADSQPINLAPGQVIRVRDRPQKGGQ